MNKPLDLHVLPMALEALDALPVSVTLADARVPDMPLVYVNHAFEQLTGYTFAEVHGCNCRFLQGHDTSKQDLRGMRRALAAGQPLTIVLRNYRKNGEHFWNELSLKPLHDADGQLVYYMGVARDISREKQLIEELASYASHDPLTGLPNRALLETRLQKSIELAQLYGRQLAVVFLDIDGFKPINDHFGHQFGDQLLRQLADRLMLLIRPADTLARMEGDAFAMVLSNLTNETDVVVLIEKIMSEVSLPLCVDEVEIQLSASLGIALCDQCSKDPAILIQNADAAMLHAKQRGRNTYQWYDQSFQSSVSQFIKVRNHLQKAISQREFTLYYQPKFDFASGRCTGVEALARWFSPDLGEIEPDEFIPIAEKTGLIIPFTEWVLAQAMQDFKQLLKVDSELRGVAVNMSPLYFSQPKFVARLTDTLAALGADSTHLEIEITESALLEDPDTCVLRMNALRDLGVKLTLDDFGTGFSSLNYLKRLPIGALKIDQSLVTELTHNKSDAAIIQGIISTAHHLDMRVIAEGIESKAQYNFLRRALCDEMQGTFRAEPMPLHALKTFLSNQLNVATADDKSNRPTVLLVDDEPNILRSLHRLLRPDGYQILLAENADQAFDLLAEHDVHVIVSDQRMRHMNGSELLHHVKSMYPNIIRIVLSGYMDLESVTTAINQGQIYKFLTKPWDDQEVRRVIRDAMRLYSDTPSATD